MVNTDAHVLESRNSFILREGTKYAKKGHTAKTRCTGDTAPGAGLHTASLHHGEHLGIEAPPKFHDGRIPDIDGDDHPIWRKHAVGGVQKLLGVLRTDCSSDYDLHACRRDRSYGLFSRFKAEAVEQQSVLNSTTLVHKPRAPLGYHLKPKPRAMYDEGM